MSKPDERTTPGAGAVSGDAAEARRRQTAEYFDSVVEERLTRLEDSNRYPDHVASDRQRKAFFDHCMSVIPKPRRVLDVGTGQGTWAVRLAMHADEVVAVDVGPENLELARRYADREGLRNVRFLQADAENTGMADASFDIVAHVSVMMYLPDPEAGLREVFRLLAPGGHLILEVPNARSLTYRLYDKREHIRRYPVDARPRLMTLNDVTALLEGCGFDVNHVSLGWSVVDWSIARACGLGRRVTALRFLLPSARVSYGVTVPIGRWLGRHKRLRPLFREFHILARKPVV